MVTEEQVLAMLSDLESPSVERTVSTGDMAKFCQAVCAFANDMPGTRRAGFLLIGAGDRDGAPSGLTASDELLRNLAGIASDGQVLPSPALTVQKIPLSSGQGDIVVVEVQPSSLPPVRYKGQIWIRRGPRRAIANETEERLLVERRTATATTFDALPCAEASLADLSLELFTANYRPQAIDAETIAENHRPIEQQLSSLRFFHLGRNCPTHAGLLLFAKNPLYWLPNAYAQYVKFAGRTMSDDVVDEKRFSGDLLTMVRDLNSFVRLVTVNRPERATPLEERMVADYPEVALREFLMNAILHRSYEAPAPVRFLQFEDRIEIQNPGPLYGLANRENFPTQTSYRNPVLAEAMKTLGFVNRFGRGVIRAQEALRKNGNEEATFVFGENHFGVILRGRT